MSEFVTSKEVKAKLIPEFGFHNVNVRQASSNGYIFILVYIPENICTCAVLTKETIGIIDTGCVGCKSNSFREEVAKAKIDHLIEGLNFRIRIIKNGAKNGRMVYRRVRLGDYEQRKLKLLRT